MRARGPVLLVIACLFAPLLWLAAPVPGRFSGTSAVLTTLGVLCGLAGVSAFALNLVLAARVPPIEAFFGGLDKMFRVHQINGRIAFSLLLAHAGLIIAGRALNDVSAGLRLLTPAAGWTVFLGVLALAGMTAAISLTLWVRLNHEVFVYVQRAFGFVFMVAMLHVFRTPGAKSASPALKYYLGALAAAGVSAFAYRSLFDNVLVKRYDYRVDGVRPLDETVTEIVMTPADRGMRFKPGQFLFVTFYSDALRRNLHPFSVRAEGQTATFSFRPGEIHEQFHPFSISSTPDEKELKVVFKEVGDYTHAMRSLEPGAWARVEGPYGGFSYQNLRNRRQVWIAGGIGITPFLSMARSLRNDDYDIHFFYAMKNMRRAYLLSEFFQISEQIPSFNVIPYVEDEVGYLTADALHQHLPDLLEREVMICGPPPMIDALRSQLHDEGVARAHIHYEKFGFTPKRSSPT